MVTPKEAERRKAKVAKPKVDNFERILKFIKKKFDEGKIRIKFAYRMVDTEVDLAEGAHETIGVTEVEFDKVLKQVLEIMGDLVEGKTEEEIAARVKRKDKRAELLKRVKLVKEIIASDKLIDKFRLHSRSNSTVIEHFSSAPSLAAVRESGYAALVLKLHLCFRKAFYGLDPKAVQRQFIDADMTLYELEQLIKELERGKEFFEAVAKPKAKPKKSARGGKKGGQG